MVVYYHRAQALTEIASVVHADLPGGVPEIAGELMERTLLIKYIDPECAISSRAQLELFANGEQEAENFIINDTRKAWWAIAGAWGLVRDVCVCFGSWANVDNDDGWVLVEFYDAAAAAECAAFDNGRHANDDFILLHHGGYGGNADIAGIFGSTWSVCDDGGHHHGPLPAVLAELTGTPNFEFVVPDSLEAFVNLMTEFDFETGEPFEDTQARVFNQDGNRLLDGLITPTPGREFSLRPRLPDETQTMPRGHGGPPAVVSPMPMPPLDD